MEILQRIGFYLSSFLLALMPTTRYVEGVVGQPTSFLPHQAISQNDKTISDLIYRGLFKYDIYGKLVPDLAETWAISDDGLVYTIKIKNNQFWSDGRQITADDLIYTSYKYPDLQGVGTDKVDDLTVRYILPNGFSPFLDLLTVGVMQADSEEKFNSLTPVSSGPFRVLRISRSGPVIKEVVLLNENEEDYIKKMTFRYYGNEDELVTAVRLGEIDAFMSNDVHDDLENFSNHRFPLQGIYFSLFFNLENEAMADIAFRENLKNSINVDEIVFNKGIFVQGPISRSLFTDPNLIFDTHDENLKVNYVGQSVTLTIPDLKQHEETARIIRKYWEDKLNLQVNIQKHNPETFVDEVVNPRNYQILLYGQEIGRDPDRYINWHSTQKYNPGLNLSLFEHVRADRALEEGRIALEYDDRLVHYHEFQKVILEQVPAVFLYHPYKNFYVSDSIRGIGEKYTFTATDRFLDFSNWSTTSDILN